MSSEDDDIELRGQCMCKWPDCGDLFPDEKALVEHLATVHRGPKDGEQGDGKFRCRWPECYTKPTLRYGIGGLKRHLYTHTMAQPYMCSEPRCNVGYYKKVELDKHIQRHHAFEGADESDTDMEDFLAAAFENDQPTERRKDVSSSGSHHHRDDAAGLTNLRAVKSRRRLPFRKQIEEMDLEDSSSNRTKRKRTQIKAAESQTKDTCPRNRQQQESERSDMDTSDQRYLADRGPGEHASSHLQDAASRSEQTNTRIRCTCTCVADEDLMKMHAETSQILGQVLGLLTEIQQRMGL